MSDGQTERNISTTQLYQHVIKYPPLCFASSILRFNSFNRAISSDKCDNLVSDAFRSSSRSNEVRASSFETGLFDADPGSRLCRKLRRSREFL